MANAVAKFKCILTGKTKSWSQRICGYVSGSPTFTVIELKDELRFLLVSYWEANKEPEEDVEDIIKSKPKWFGIVDGCHFHAAVTELQDEQPDEWQDFVWKVVVLQHTPMVSQLRQLARVLNERNKPTYSFDVTIFDLLNGLRMEYDLLVQERKRESRSGNITICSRDIAQAYDGGDHFNNTSVRQAAGIAIKLHPATISAIGEVVNKSCADVIAKSKDLNTLQLETEEDVMAHQDCRLFKSFVCFGSLRSASNFLKAVATKDTKAQTNTIYRIAHYSERHDYKPVQAKVVSEQFEFAKRALEEEALFLDVIGETKWPEHMAMIQENLLRTTLCDKELSRNMGNDGDVLPSLWKCFKSLFPAKAKVIETADSEPDGSAVGREGGSNEDADARTPPSGLDGNQPGNSDEEEEKEPLTPEQEEELRVSALQQNADSKLSTLGIHTHEMPLSHFSSMHWTPRSRKADLIFSCITDINDEDFIKNLPSFCKLVLNPGSYVFLILTVHQFVALFNDFKNEGFKVSEHPFDIVYDVSTVQRRHMADFPQRHSDIALVCRSSGDHPSGFQPFRITTQDSDGTPNDDDDDGGEAMCRAHFASLLNVSACRKKLKRPRCNSALFSWERNYELIIRIVQTFCPFQGLVIDPFPGALSTALACLKASRECISISPECENIKYATGRLRIYATGTATMEELEDYSRPLKLDAQELAQLRSRTSSDDEPVSSQAQNPTNSAEHDDCEPPVVDDLELPVAEETETTVVNDGSNEGTEESDPSSATKRRRKTYLLDSTEKDKSAAQALMTLNTEPIP